MKEWESKNEKDEEEGQVFFHSSGLCSVEWEYRGHRLVCLIKTEYNKGKAEDTNVFSIYLNGKDVTSEYIEQFHLKPQRIRTTVSNISKAVQIINENMDKHI